MNLVEAKGFTLKAHGSDYVMCWPLHDDNTPSLVTTPSKNIWRCMRACQKAGSVVDSVIRIESFGFRHAVELLRNEFLPLAADSDEAPKLVKQNSKQKLSTPLVANANIKSRR